MPGIRLCLHAASCTLPAAACRQPPSRDVWVAPARLPDTPTPASHPAPRAAACYPPSHYANASLAVEPPVTSAAVADVRQQCLESLSGPTTYHVRACASSAHALGDSLTTPGGSARQLAAKPHHWASPCRRSRGRQHRILQYTNPTVVAAPPFQYRLMSNSEAPPGRTCRRPSVPRAAARWTRLARARSLMCAPLTTRALARCSSVRAG